jgi:hypothetical protein
MVDGQKEAGKGARMLGNEVDEGERRTDTRDPTAVSYPAYR